MSASSAPWLYGDTKPVETQAVASATVIASNDIVGLDGSGLPFAASDQAWDTNLATTQAAFILLFLGITADRSRAGDVDPIVVNTAAVHRFDCASATFEVGDLVGPAKQSGNGLERAKVVAVATESLAIGRVAKRGTSITEVWVDIQTYKFKTRTT